MNKFVAFLSLALLLFILTCFSKGAEDFFCSYVSCGERNVLYFDALNALFTGLAFLGLVATLFLQWKDLHETKEDIDKQNKTLELQRFEASFFNMLSQHNEMLSQLKMKNMIGREVISYIVQGNFIEDKEKPTLKFLLNVMGKDDLSTAGATDSVNREYERVYEGYSYILGIYFRSLFRIFIFLETSMPLKDRFFYSNIIRSQLSDDELLLLFINGLTKKGSKFKEKIEQYKLLDNMPRIIAPNFMCLYQYSAFGEEVISTRA